MWTVVGFGYITIPVEEAMTNTFTPKLLGLKIISGRLRNLLDIGSKRARPRIPDPTEAAYESHQMLQA